jgi:hypothetical protein
MEERFRQDNVTYFGEGQNWRMIFPRDNKNRNLLVVRQHGQDRVGSASPEHIHSAQ